jgi:hypothetical protein
MFFWAMMHVSILCIQNGEKDFGQLDLQYWKHAIQSYLF